MLLFTYKLIAFQFVGRNDEKTAIIFHESLIGKEILLNQTDTKMERAQVKSIHNAAHYIWGANCDGWHLLKTPTLSVIQERMPPGTKEQIHFHHLAQQLFYILSGIATFEIEGDTIIVKASECIHVPNGTQHNIANNYSEDLSFLVISEPNSHGDRMNIISENQFLKQE